VNRIGMFIGPFAGAGLMHFMGLAGAYWFGIVALLAAGVVSYYMPELRVDDKRAQGVAVPPRVGQVARAHARVFLTLGLGILLISAMRAARQIVIPLWAITSAWGRPQHRLSSACHPRWTCWSSIRQARSWTNAAGCGWPSLVRSSWACRLSSCRFPPAQFPS